MLSHFENLLQEIVADPGRRLLDFRLMTQAEQHQLLVEWNDTKRDYPEDKCVHQLFEEQVERTPDAAAVVFESQKLTYRELNQRANQLAHYLIRLGVEPEQLVGIFMARSLEMVVAVLGILKAGAAYVPLDPESPKERLVFFLQDTKISIVVTQQPLIERLPSGEAHPMCLDPDWVTLRQERTENPIFRGTPTRLAYVTYTSGSTGQPKGVMIEHKSLVNYLHWVNSCLFSDDIGTVPMTTEITFDACLKQLFAPLLCGKQVWLVPRGLVMQPSALLEEIRRNVRVGLNCVPSLWAAILNEIDSIQAMTLAKTLKCVFLGGERLSEELVTKSFAALPALKIWNLYGPTETTANASNGRIASSGKVTIGNPVSNTEIYLLDNQLQPVPVGVTGEVYIGGVGLARGYLNGPELTAEKFIASPVSSLPGERLYRTGDLARYVSDGNIEFLGRIDHQVKIRGFRIELGEIESALSQHPSVHEDVVLAREDVVGDKRLVAYIVSNQQPAPSTDNLYSFLKQKLPDYMIPSAFVFLDALPLTSNGKVDRQALPPPGPSRRELETAFVVPRTPTEDLLAKAWAELLKLEKVGIHDNFFDLGGHSLLAMQVISRLRSAVNLDVPLRSLFENPTIAGLAELIDALSWAGKRYQASISGSL
jgi:amino acid adenylation domain-containing protein